MGIVNHVVCPSDNDPGEYDPLSTPNYDMTGPASGRVISGYPHSTFNVTSSINALQLGGPPPISVAVINSAVELFARIFPAVPIRHRAQMVEHFSECIRLTKSTRQEAVQINVFAALLGALRRLAETKLAFGEDSELRKSSTALIMATLSSPNVLLRCAAGECLGRLAQLVSEPSFFAELAQQVFDRLHSVRTPISRAGQCLAVGCLHRYVGGLASGQHLSTSVGVLLAIAQDSSVPEVQVWAVHALTLIADSGGPMFREFVSPSLNLVLQLLLRSPSAVGEIQRSLGRLLNALITTLGPELQGSGAPITTSRQACSICCLIMRESSDVVLQAEAISCLQRLHMFAPKLAESPESMAAFQQYISSPHLLLRRVAVSYLRQLSHKGSDCFHEFNFVFNPANGTGITASNNGCDDVWDITPLLLQLFERFDLETDVQTRRDIEEVIVSFLQNSVHKCLTQWLKVLKEVLQATTNEKSSFNHGGTNSGPPNNNSPLHGNQNNSTDIADIHDENSANEDEEPNVGETLGGSVQLNMPLTVRLNSRWSTKVFAVGCLSVIISSCHRLAKISAKRSPHCLVNLESTCQEESITYTKPSVVDCDAVAHFDLALARCLKASDRATAAQNVDFLVLYLTDLVRIACMSSTSDSDKLKLAGFKLLQDVIRRYAEVPDPEFPDHSLLEQYQAQVSAALSPAFSSSTSSAQYDTNSTSTGKKSVPPNPEIASLACLVCSTWLASGVARNLQDTQRFYGLLRGAFERLKFDDLPKNTSANRRASPVTTSSGQLYSEDALNMEKLSILRAWANIYMVSWPQHGGRRCSEELNQCSTDADQYDADDVTESDQLSEDESQDRNKGQKALVRNDGKSKRKHGSRTQKLLSSLLRPLLPMLSTAWFAALKDYALLNLPDELSNQRPPHGGTFFGPDANIEHMRSFYLHHWPTFLFAASVWMQSELYVATEPESFDAVLTEPRRKDLFDLILGLSIYTLCDSTLKQSLPVVNTCLQAICHLLSRTEPRGFLMRNYPDAPLELLHVLYRLLLTRDSVDLHLLCLTVTSHILVAAQERLVQQRESWFSQDADASKVCLTPEANGKQGNNGNMVSSVLLQTTSHVDLNIFELCEGGTLDKFDPPKDSEKLSDSSIHTVGLSSDRSIVLGCLEVVVCTLSRYRPEILASLPRAETSGLNNDRVHTMPETRCVSSPNAPLVLAAAVQCLIPLPDLCAPRVLLAELNAVSLSETQLNNGVGVAMCTDNLLKVLLELLVKVTKTALFHPTGSALAWFVDQQDGLQNRNGTIDFYGSIASNIIELFGVGDLDAQITSTAASSETASAVRRKRFENEIEKRRIDELVGWTPSQSRLVDVLVTLAIKLASHPYPTLAVVKTDPSDRVTKNSIGEQSTECVSDDAPDSTCGQADTLIESICKPVASDVWYDHISNTLVELLHHDHLGTDESQSWTCCLGAVAMVSRIASHCPLVVFKSRELRAAITTQISRIWKLANSNVQLKTPFDAVSDRDDSDSSVDCTAPLRGLRYRRICLAAVELLINHHEMSVSTFFIRTLVPQNFKWLQNLSLLHEAPSPQPCLDGMHVSKDEFVDTLHASIDVLESLVDIASPENRQGLLLLIVPLLCSLLSEPFPTNAVISRWLAATPIVGDFDEFKCGLHLTALRHLISMAPRFQAEFRSVLNALGELKPKLEGAIKHYRFSAQLSAEKASHPIPDGGARHGEHPVIQLKTDFSNFAQV